MVDTREFHPGSRLRRTREFRGLEQRDLARMLGLGVENLDRLERGAARLEGAILFAAGKALRVDPSFFFKRLKRFDAATTIIGLDWVAPLGGCINDNRDWVRKPRRR